MPFILPPHLSSSPPRDHARPRRPTATSRLAPRAPNAPTHPKLPHLPKLPPTRPLLAFVLLAVGACGGAAPAGSAGAPSMSQAQPDATGGASASTGGAAGAAVVGGGGGGAAGDGAGGSVSPSATSIAGGGLCAALAQAACEGAQRCCQAPAQPLAACVTQQLGSCQQQLMPLISDARSGYDPVAGADVIARFQSLASTCDPGLVDWASPRTGLLGMFAGTVASGGSCPPRSTTDGAAVVSCMGAEICHIAGVGQAHLTGTCGLPRASSGTCLIDTECDPGQQLRCDFESPVSGGVAAAGSEQSLGLHGHCVPRLAEGAKCARATECTSLICENKACAPRTVDRVYCIAAS
jgi:hypothetical protein